VADIFALFRACPTSGFGNLMIDHGTQYKIILWEELNENFCAHFQVAGARHGAIPHSPFQPAETKDVVTVAWQVPWNIANRDKNVKAGNEKPAQRDKSPKYHIAFTGKAERRWM